MKGLGKMVLFLGLFWLIAAGLQSLLNAGMRGIATSEPGAFNRAMMGKVGADIVVSGSSRAYAHYDPAILSKITGRTAFNLGRNGSHTDVQLTVLKAYLSVNRKPALVVHNLDMHTFVPTLPDEIFGPALYQPYLQIADLYQGLLRINPRVRLWRHLPLYGYVVEDANFGWALGLRAMAGGSPPEDHIEGYYPRDLTWTPDFDRFKAKNPNGVGFAAEESGVRMMVDLIATCRSQGIPLLMVYSPQYYEMVSLVTNKTEVFGRFEGLSKEYGVGFWDYTGSELCRDKQYFYNSQHLNRSGATLFSTDLANRLVREGVVGGSAGGR